MIARRGQAQQVLQDDLDRREIEQVRAPDHVGDALVRVIKGGGEEIGHDVLALATEHDIPDPGLRGGSVDAVPPGMSGSGFVKTEVMVV